MVGWRRVLQVSCHTRTRFHTVVLWTIGSVVAALTGIAVAAVAARWRSRRPSAAKPWLRALLSAAVVCYLPASNVALRVFGCVRVEGEWRLSADMREGCLYGFGSAPDGVTGRWPVMALVAAITIVVFVIGLPALLLHYSVRRDSQVRVGECCGVRSMLACLRDP